MIILWRIIVTISSIGRSDHVSLNLWYVINASARAYFSLTVDIDNKYHQVIHNRLQQRYIPKRWKTIPLCVWQYTLCTSPISVLERSIRKDLRWRPQRNSSVRVENSVFGQIMQTLLPSSFYLFMCIMTHVFIFD